MKILDRLFNKDSISELSNQLTQEEREAIADLLLLATCGENELSLDQDKVLAADSVAFGWRSGVDFDRYRVAMTSRVKEVDQDDKERDAYLRNIADRLKSSETRKTALGVLQNLFTTDKESIEDTSFFKHVAMHIPPA